MSGRHESVGHCGMKRYVIVLILLIVGAVGLAVPLLVDRSSEDQAGIAGGEGLRYVCDRCRRQFTLTPEEYTRQVPDAEIVEKDRTAARRPHCPLCGATHSGWMMVRCPKCGHWYLPPGSTPEGSTLAAEAKDVCPKCRTDRGKWYSKHRLKGG